MKDKNFGTPSPWQVKFMRRMAVLLLASVLFSAVIMARADVQEPLRIRCEWRAADSGSASVIYQLHVMDLDGGIDTTYVVPASPGSVQEFFFVDGDYLRRYVARVRGVDADGDEGQWSDWSAIYAFEVADPEP